MLEHFRNHHVRNRAASLLEFTVLIIVLMAVFLSMSSYTKRAIQGRWKGAIDDMGDQYDPQQTNSTTLYNAVTNSNTTVSIQDAPGGYFTDRVDRSKAKEQHTVNMQVGQEGNPF